MIGWVVLTSTRTSSARRFLEVSQSWLLHASIWALATLTADVSVFMARCLLVAASPGLDAGCQFRHRTGQKSGRSCPIQSVLLVKPVWTAVKGRMRRGELLLPGHFAFLQELSAHNDREWFAANKERYERRVRTPALYFIRAVAPEMAKTSKELVAGPRPKGGSLLSRECPRGFPADHP